MTFILIGSHSFFCIWYCRKYGLEDDTIDFIGHALALHFDDSYLNGPALDFVKRMKVKTTVFYAFYLFFNDKTYLKILHYNISEW